MNTHWIKIGLLSAALLTGCASNDSAKIYTQNETMQVARARSGQIEQIRDVEVKPGKQLGIGGVAGGVVGGVLAGNHIGQGTGSVISSVFGALLGGFVGNQLEDNMRSKMAKEITVRMHDNGERLVIVQDGDQALRVGQKVDVIANANNARVVPAQP
ncbi:glycine zipper 2TM domain-containing protein [uncultured Deefgea sp.]|uniref:glycine zipper 2TM domain-containing protein n=1 Tax=uncultured Deefgea sp. TaxID=1304914 RepID=UPI00262F23DC|nr:glycine zipper 2TM domain-containing protein [uncultured Deefgea sp.]